MSENETSSSSPIDSVINWRFNCDEIMEMMDPDNRGPGIKKMLEWICSRYNYQEYRNDFLFEIDFDDMYDSQLNLERVFARFILILEDFEFKFEDFVSVIKTLNIWITERWIEYYKEDIEKMRIKIENLHLMDNVDYQRELENELLDEIDILNADMMDSETYIDFWKSFKLHDEYEDE